MKLRFLDRVEEMARLRRLLARTEGRFAVLYGRRRCGKSRLLQEALRPHPSVYYMADERESSLQTSALAKEIARRVPGFDRVSYPDWDALFSRWWSEARPGMSLALDEFPALVAKAREIPSVLQKHVDLAGAASPHLVLAGSSQRMMQGLVMDRSAPLYGRASEILKIAPLPCGWIGRALNLSAPSEAVEAFSVWGGVPRYWELAADFEELRPAMESLILSPWGVLHNEPARLLLDDLREIAQAASIMTLIGQGCHRLSEIAARLSKPATSLSRPLQRLLELELVRRDLPWGTSIRDSKRTLYRIADPFLRFWFRYVEPHRSQLAAGQLAGVGRSLSTTFQQHVSSVWEELVRESVPRARYFGKTWKTAGSWWGTGLDRAPMEIDVLAEDEDGGSLLVGEAKWSSPGDAGRILAALRRKAEALPPAAGRKVHLGLWLKSAPVRPAEGMTVFAPEDVLPVLI